MPNKTSGGDVAIAPRLTCSTYKDAGDSPCEICVPLEKDWGDSVERRGFLYVMSNQDQITQGGGYMKRMFIIISVFMALIYYVTSAQAFDKDLIQLHGNLFKILSQKIRISTEELKEFNILINDYMTQGKKDFGRSAIFYSSNIAIVNGSLIVGHAFRQRKVSSADIKFIRQKYNNLYLLLFTYLVPFTMVNKYPRYVLNNNIIPTYAGVVSFEEVKDIYFKHLDLTHIPPHGQLVMLKTITGVASGIALAEKRQLLTVADIENAKAVSCDTYPECGRMLAENMFRFAKEYQMKITEIYFGK